MRTLSEIISTLKDSKNYLIQQYKLKEIGVFGSFVRSEQTNKSDVDVLVDFDETPSLFRFIHLENYLSEKIGLKVDLVLKSSLKPLIGKQILSEVITL